MDSSQTRQQINELLNEIGKLVNNTGISSLEKDLLKQKCILLYDAINKLQGTTGKVETTPPPPVVEAPPVKQKVQEIKPLVQEQVNKADEIEFVPEPPPVKKEVPVEQVKKETEYKKQNEEIDRIIEQRKKEVADNNLFQQHLIHHKSEEMHIHEKLSSANTNRNVKDHLHQKVESLKSAISLNKKIAFVNVLFKENTVEYAKAIEKLNSALTLDEAMRYFNELKHQYAWENNHEMVKELEQLITKRFS